MLICNQCGIEMTMKNFHTPGQCWECRKRYMRRYYAKNFKTEVRKYSRNGRLSLETEKKFPI